jgi:hypothetical protein
MSWGFASKVGEMLQDLACAAASRIGMNIIIVQLQSSQEITKPFVQQRIRQD